MPSFYVEVSKSELLDELSDEDIREEAEQRKLSLGVYMSCGEQEQTLMASADFLRSHGQYSLANRLDDMRYLIQDN